MELNKSKEDQIKAYFNGQLSASSEDSLLKWIKEKPENKAAFISIKQSLNPDTIEHPLLQNSYTELKSKLVLNHQFNKLQVSKTRKLIFSFQKVAALLVFAVIFGFALSYILNKTVLDKSEVVWFETQVPRGEKSQLLLPDGSKVWINAESKISYPSNFMKGNREIKLSGEAYFEVAKLNGKRFVVETKDYNVEVLGTKFNVTAYEDFNKTETTLVEGKVQIIKGNQQVVMLPGEQISYSNGKLIRAKTDATKSAKWKDDIFDFDQISFEELMLRLERWYNVDIEISNKELMETTYSGIFKNEETIYEILNTFQHTMPIKYEEVEFRKFKIYKN